MVSTRQQCSGSSGSTAKVAVLSKAEKSYNVVSLVQNSSIQSNQVNLLNLPYEILEKILLNTSFKHISQFRSVCYKHNMVSNLNKYIFYFVCRFLDSLM